MASKYKFLILIFLSVTGLSGLLSLFLQTDYAKREQAYFHQYPYQEMAHRVTQNDSIVVASSSPSMEKILDAVQLVSPVQAAVNITFSPKETRKISPPRPENSTKPEATGSKASKLTVRRIADPAPGLRPKKIPAISTQKWRHAAMLGYAAYEAKKYQTAITYFEIALQYSPNNLEIHTQLAYAYKFLGQNSKAIKHYKAAIDHHEGIPPIAIKREIEQLENRFDIISYAIYRGASSSIRPLGADLTQSQAGLGVSYQPENIGFRNGKTLQFYSRLLSSMTQNSLKPNPHSYQAGVGLRLKPFADHNLVLSAERMIKVGNFARNDWMIRAGYSQDYKSGYRSEKAPWWSYSLYLDAALIKPADPDIFLTSQVTAGYNISVSDTIILQPRLTGLYSWQKDRFRQASLFEAGPGLNLRYYFNDTKYEAFRSHIDVTVEYRVKLSGNSIDGSGPVVGLILQF